MTQNKKYDSHFIQIKIIVQVHYTVQILYCIRELTQASVLLLIYLYFTWSLDIPYGRIWGRTGPAGSGCI